MEKYARWLQLTGYLVLVALIAGCFSGQSGREKGVREATAEIAAGHLKLKEYPPLPYPPGHQEYVKMLREQCGVANEVPIRPSGLSEDVFIEEVRGWNGTMETEIKRQFGERILEELHKDARKRWETQVNPDGKE